MVVEGEGLQRLRCGISIQGRIRERLFYKDGQIELRRRFYPVREGRGGGGGGDGEGGFRGKSAGWRVTVKKEASCSHVRATLLGRSSGDVAVPNGGSGMQRAM